MAVEYTSRMDRDRIKVVHCRCLSEISDLPACVEAKEKGIFELLQRKQVVIMKMNTIEKKLDLLDK